MGSRRIVVVGGGPAGVEAALAAASGGAQVTLVSEGPLGGRASWDSLIPSKIWLDAADGLGEVTGMAARGLGDLPLAQVQPDLVLARIRRVAEGWSSVAQSRLAALGVSVRNGVASLSGPGRLSLAEGEGQAPTLIEADDVILASGSVPRFPPGLRPDGKRVLAPRFAGSLRSLPPDIVVVGGGATGSEFASLFARLGVRVTWLVGPRGVLPELAPAAGHDLTQALAAHGVSVQIGAAGARVEPEGEGVVVTDTAGGRHAAAMAFLAIGRTPDLGRLNLAAVGLSPDAQGLLAVDGYGRTAAAGIYAVGDAAGGPMLANRAMAQAWIAGRHAAGLTVEAYRPETVIHAVYSDPEVAQVGLLEGSDAEVCRVRLPYPAVLKSWLAPAASGWFELAYDPASRQVRGAVAIGAHAADLLAPVALAIQVGVSLEQLAATFAAHPAISELAFAAARVALETSV